MISESMEIIRVVLQMKLKQIGESSLEPMENVKKGNFSKEWFAR